MEREAKNIIQKDKVEALLTSEEKKQLFAKRELFRTLGLDIDSIPSPEEAPVVVDFAKLWSQAGYKDNGVTLPIDYEVYVGADYKPGKRAIEVTEVTHGEEFTVTPKKLHFIELHNEPKNPETNDAGLNLHENLPNPHYDDMFDFLTSDKIFCSVIIRMIDQKNAGVFLALKTDEFVGYKLPLKLSSEFFYSHRPRIKCTLKNDDTLTVYNGVAIYRGFIDLPPKKGKGYLRLRKAS